MKRATKLKLLGWTLFAIALSVQILNIVLASNSSASNSNQEFLAMLFLWSQLLMFPQVFGVILVMYAGWRYR